MSTVIEEEDFPNYSLEFNFPSIQETAEKPNEQQQRARHFLSLQEEALSLVIVFSQPPKCLHQAV